MTNLVAIAPCFYQSDEPARRMLASAHHHHLLVHLYGVGKPFMPHGADAQVVQLLDQLASISNPYVLVTDCRDVLFLGDSAEIMERYLHYSSPLVMSAETGCWPPNDEVLHGMPQTSTRYRYVNAGQYIGETRYVKECLRHLIDRYRGTTDLDNSQAWWPLALIRKELDFTVDSRCLLFQTMSGGADVKVLGGRVYNPETITFPSSIHYNGCCGNPQPYNDMYERLYGQS